MMCISDKAFKVLVSLEKVETPDAMKQENDTDQQLTLTKGAH